MRYCKEIVLGEEKVLMPEAGYTLDLTFKTDNGLEPLMAFY